MGSGPKENTFAGAACFVFQGTTPENFVGVSPASDVLSLQMTGRPLHCPMLCASASNSDLESFRDRECPPPLSSCKRTLLENTPSWAHCRSSLQAQIVMLLMDSVKEAMTPHTFHPRMIVAYYHTTTKTSFLSSPCAANP